MAEPTTPTVSFDGSTYSVAPMEGVTISWKINGRRLVVMMRCLDRCQMFTLEDEEWPTHPVLQ
jgi:hypothetical protein